MSQRILKRFPYRLNVGTDICHISRMHKILESSKGVRFIRKILHPEERKHPKVQWLLRNEESWKGGSFEDGNSRTTSGESVEPHVLVQDGIGESEVSSLKLQIAATFMAGRFAAKEAVIKAHPHRSIYWHDITISRQPSKHPDRDGAPMAIIKDVHEDHEALISISHDGDYATATCLGTYDN